MDRLQDFFRRLFSIRSIVPLLIILGAFISLFIPSVFGLSQEQIILALLGLLAFDALFERTEFLSIIERDLKSVKTSIESQSGAINFLKYRRDFPRLEHIIASAKKEIWISGTSLDGMVTFVGTFQSKKNDGVNIKFLAVDPEGTVIQDISNFFLTEPEDFAARSL